MRRPSRTSPGPALRRLLFTARKRFECNGGLFGRVVLDSISPAGGARAQGACSLRSSPTCIERRLRESRPCPCPGSQARIKLARFDACLREAAFRSLARAGAGGRRRAARHPPSRARGGCRGPTGSLGRRARTPAGTRGPARGSSKPASDSAPLAPSALCSCCTRSTCSPRCRPTGSPWRRWRQAMPAATLTRSTETGLLGRLVAAALFALGGRATSRTGEPAAPDDRRALWARFGIGCDELSCTALTLGRRPHRLARGYLVSRLRAAALAGRPVVLTLAELRAEPPRLTGDVLFVCENPSIAAAARTLGSLPAALVHRRLAEHGPSPRSSTRPKRQQWRSSFTPTATRPPRRSRRECSPGLRRDRGDSWIRLPACARRPC